MSADSLNDDHSSRSKATTDANSGGGGGVNISQSRRGSLTSPRASVVRGDSEPISTSAATLVSSSLSPQPISAAIEQESASENVSMENLGPETKLESSDTVNDGNAGSPKRPAWNRPINAVVDPGSVMGGAVSWPALSEPISSPVPTSSESSFSDCSPSSFQRQDNGQANANVTENHTMPTRQRPLGHRGRGGGGMSPRNGPSQPGFNSIMPTVPPPVRPPYIRFEVPHATVVTTVMDTPVRGVRPMGGVRGSQLHTINDRSLHRNNSRRGNFGQRGHGDGPHYNNHGGRRYQDRRDGRFPHQYIRPPTGFLPPPAPPGNATLIRHPPMTDFADSRGFHMAPQAIYYPTLPLGSFRTMQLGPSPPPPPPPMPTTLPALIIQQIDYYFSDANLEGDYFLRGKMDTEGWVSISLIATFRRVQKLTHNIQTILDSLRASSVVEVQGDKIRKRNGWKKWLQTSNQVNADSGSQASAENLMATSLQKKVRILVKGWLEKSTYQK
ncbi:unnamed protein product [Fraxinus pennsylvanica]|uniref:HTH La-type RNA-binding domain-containing protein n=1 Tax=Fraxinus pennsylvanica TaxID=56036 RepID=A0AAD1YL59_9LAMI|nr:unnamed protein product [Fraxinus pennsylvanica]